MSEVTLKAIEELMDRMLDDKFDGKLKPIKETLDQHTTALDGLVKDVKTLVDEKTVNTGRLDRLEKWGQKVGPKVGIQLEF